MAHVLELPNKLALDGPIWLAIQQGLYRGWGPVFGPVEIAALLTAIALAVARRGSPPCLWRTIFAAAGYAAMLGAFFVFNEPVNSAVARWTPDSLPPDWPAYRRQWEIGHALSAALSIVALSALIGAWRRDDAA
jgi:hypothetical protein